VSPARLVILPLVSTGEWERGKTALPSEELRKKGGKEVRNEHTH
jgi:hypothetical protein